MKKLILVMLILFAIESHAKEGVQCSSLFIQPYFESGHNVPLRNIMIKMKEYEDTIREFVESLITKNESRFLPETLKKYRDVETLSEIIDIAKKYEKILSHLVKHSDQMMMSPRIQMIPAEKRQEFMEKYKQAYVNYHNTFQKLVFEFESYKEVDPKNWDPRVAKDILMQLHSQMGAAHNKF